MKILIVDDDDLVQKTMQFTFSDSDVTSAETGEEALKLIKAQGFNVLFLDIRLKGKLTGVDVLKKAREIDPLLPIIMMSGLDDDEIQRQCLELGAVDYLVKGTLDESAYRHKLNNAAVWRKKEAELLSREPKMNPKLCESYLKYRGPSKFNEELHHRIEVIGKTDGPFLIFGASGTGKELAARAIWAAFGDEHRPFIKVNCGAIAATLIESELFGHEKNAFTGATERRMGLFEAANGGDIFLDEIGELTLEFQPKLLRVLQEKSVRAVGSNHEKKFDFRVIAATNRDLWAEAKRKNFRDDLLYRLDVHRIFLPPLRKRSEDIESLMLHFFKSEGLRNVEISHDLLKEIIAFEWPGNVRQLMTFVTSVAPMIDPVQPVLTPSLWEAWKLKPEELSAFMDGAGANCAGANGGNGVAGKLAGETNLSPRQIKNIILERIKNGDFNYDKASKERQLLYIETALEYTHQNQAAAARLLGISKQRLQMWLRELKPPESH